MMRTCDLCPQWAQWRGEKKEGEVVREIKHLCAMHKDLDKTEDMKFIFVGAMPLGLSNSKS